MLFLVLTTKIYIREITHKKEAIDGYSKRDGCALLGSSQSDFEK
jgi:hypothetical protein